MTEVGLQLIAKLASEDFRLFHVELSKLYEAPEKA